MKSEKNQLFTNLNRSYSWNKQTKLTNFLILTIVILFVASTISYFYYISLSSKTKTQEQTKNEQVIESKNLKNRKGPLFGINGTISSLKKSLNDTKLIVKSDLGVDYQVTVGPKTQIFSITRQLTDKEVKTTRTEIQVEQLKTGDRIYLESNKDLIQTTDISPNNIKSIEIFKE